MQQRVTMSITIMMCLLLQLLVSNIGAGNTIGQDLSPQEVILSEGDKMNLSCPQYDTDFNWCLVTEYGCEEYEVSSVDHSGNTIEVVGSHYCHDHCTTPTPPIPVCNDSLLFCHYDATINPCTGTFPENHFQFIINETISECIPEPTTIYIPEPTTIYIPCIPEPTTIYIPCIPEPTTIYIPEPTTIYTPCIPEPTTIYIPEPTTITTTISILETTCMTTTSKCVPETTNCPTATTTQCIEPTSQPPPSQCPLCDTISEYNCSTVCLESVVDECCSAASHPITMTMVLLIAALVAMATVSPALQT